MASLIDGTGLADAHEGNPSAAGEKALKATVDALGWPEGDAQQIVKDFREEFSRETPYRIRFFSLLAERVVARGTPLVLVPLTFGCREHIQIAFGSPVALTGVRGNCRQRVVKVLTPQRGTAEYSLDDFGRDFVVQRYD